MSFRDLNVFLDHFAHNISPEQRKILTRKLAQGLRIRMIDRIKKQKQPDGRSFIPRKRNQIGNIKRTGAMFQNIHRFIKTESSENQVCIGFNESTARIAKIHQYGLVDQPTAKASPVRYKKRELVGFSDEDKEFIINEIINFLKITQ